MGRVPGNKLPGYDHRVPTGQNPTVPNGLLLQRLIDPFCGLRKYVLHSGVDRFAFAIGSFGQGDVSAQPYLSDLKQVVSFKNCL